MIVTCEVCHGQRNITPLSAPRLRCSACRELICPDCEEGRCRVCDALMHASCCCTVGEDWYCEAHGGEALKQIMLDELYELTAGELQRVCLLAKNDFLRTATIAELLAASATIAEMRKATVKDGTNE